MRISDWSSDVCSSDLFEQCRCSLHIADIARRQHKGIGAAENVGQGMDLGCPAAARTTDRLRLAPPFPPKAERWALRSEARRVGKAWFSTCRSRWSTCN